MTLKRVSALAAFIGLSSMAWGVPAAAAARVPGFTAMPEARYALADSESLDEYKEYMARLDEPARQWAVQSGLFLEDGHLDWMEKRILGRVSGKKHQVWFLTSPRMMDGVGFMDLVYAWMWDYRKDPAVGLVDEVSKLEEKGDLPLVPKGSAKAMEGLVKRAVKDAQTAIGLALIGNYGKPRSESMEYPVPQGNIQLAMLCHNLSRVKPLPSMEPRDAQAVRDHLSLAAASVYGPLYAASDKGLQGGLREYVPGIVRYMQEMFGNGVTMAPLTAPVTALAELVWTPSAFVHPPFLVGDGIQSSSWYDRLRKRPFTTANFDWQFPSVELLRSVGTYLAKDLREQGIGVEEGLRRLYNTLGTVSEKDALKWSVLYKGKRIKGSHAMNPEYYWGRYRQGLRVPGDSLDRAQLVALAAKSLGVPAVIGRIVVDKGLYGESFALLYSDGRFFSRLEDLSVAKNNRGVERVQVAFHKTPWDGFRFETKDALPLARVMNLDTADVRLLGGGIPPGYPFRRRNPGLVVEFGPEVTVRKDGV